MEMTMAANTSPETPRHQIAEGVCATQNSLSGAPPEPCSILVSSIATLKVAINRHVKNKIARGDSFGWSNATFKFKNIELAPDAFIAEVEAGYACCAWLDAGPVRPR